MATITLENMQFYAHHGCFAEERKVGTNFSVTVTFSYDATIAAATDNLEQAVNYLEPNHIMLSASHTHSAPRIKLDTKEPEGGADKESAARDLSSHKQRHRNSI